MSDRIGSDRIGLGDRLDPAAASVNADVEIRSLPLALGSLVPHERRPLILDAGSGEPRG